MKIIDKVFGELYYDDIWEKPYSFEFHGRTLKIMIMVEAEEDAKFFNYQYRAYQWFTRYPKEITEHAMQVLISHIQQNPDEFPGLEGESLSLELTEVIILNTFVDNYDAIAVLFESNAEPEHGLGVQYVNGNVSRVGIQSEVFTCRIQRLDLVPPKMVAQSRKLFKHRG